jgi:hypothetical protein
MLKKKFIIFFVVLIAALGCAQSGQVVEAEEKYSVTAGWGTPSFECKQLEENVSIRIERNPRTRCADVVIPYYKSGDCTQGKDEEITGKHWKEDKRLPREAFSGGGNQVCQEAFVVYQNSPYCFQYTSGGRTRYIPPG